MVARLLFSGVQPQWIRPRYDTRLNPALPRKAFDRLTTLGRAAASRFNERPQLSRLAPGIGNSAGRSCVVAMAKGRAAAPTGSHPPPRGTDRA